MDELKLKAAVAETKSIMAVASVITWQNIPNEGFLRVEANLEFIKANSPKGKEAEYLCDLFEMTPEEIVSNLRAYRNEKRVRIAKIKEETAILRKKNEEMEAQNLLLRARLEKN